MQLRTQIERKHYSDAALAALLFMTEQRISNLSILASPDLCCGIEIGFKQFSVAFKAYLERSEAKDVQSLCAIFKALSRIAK